MKLAGSSMDGDPRVERLEAANQQLQEGLKACQELVEHYRSKLAANRNDLPLLRERAPDDDTPHS
jgi:hypothetical protein